MTRLAILSDVHANLPALEAVIEDMQPFEPDHVIVAGDLINIGPFSPQVMERITELGWAKIRGNHEFYLLNYRTPRQPEHWDEWTLLPRLYEELKGHWHNVIAAMPDELTLYYQDAPPVRVVHGLPGDPWNAIDPDTLEEKIHEWLKDVQETTYISGHYHLAFERLVGKWQIINPGSLGVPLDGYRKAGYAILDGNADGWTPTFRRVDYDFMAVTEEYRRQGYMEKYGGFGYTVMLQIPTARPMISAYYRWHREHYPDDPNHFSVAQVDEFLQSGTFWDYMPDGYRVNEHLLPELLDLVYG